MNVLLLLDECTSAVAVAGETRLHAALRAAVKSESTADSPNSNLNLAVVTVCGQRLALNLLQADLTGRENDDDSMQEEQPLHSRVLALGVDIEDTRGLVDRGGFESGRGGGKSGNSYSRGLGWRLERAA